ncbi:MAG: hypothetical protein WKH64_16635 [Chloroflexia bacterium]
MVERTSLGVVCVRAGAGADVSVVGGRVAGRERRPEICADHRLPL